MSEDNTTKLDDTPDKTPETAPEQAAEPATAPKPAKKTAVKKKVFKKKAYKKKVYKKKVRARIQPTSARPAATAAPAAAHPRTTATGDSLSRLVSAMDELREATQDFVCKELEAQRDAILSFQKTTRSTLEDLEAATLRTLKKLSS